MDYIELTVKLTPREPWSDILTAELADIGFDSFVETEEGVQAYIPTKDYQKELIFTATILGQNSNEFQFEIDEKLIPHQNWNEEWESGFNPVYVDDLLTIRAPFHDQSCVKGMEVIIQPQMSFGTGHHETTWLMSKSLFELNPFPKTVLDMGTGTGVLAIIAEKLGGEQILAIDIEDWSVENTIENVERNECSKITSLCGDISLLGHRKFELILANINKNVLKAHLPHYSKSLEIGGQLFMSGFFETDIQELIAEANQYGLVFVSQKVKATWACIQFKK